MWRFLCWWQTTDKTDCFTPCACVRGNYDQSVEHISVGWVGGERYRPTVYTAITINSQKANMSIFKCNHLTFKFLSSLSIFWGALLYNLFLVRRSFSTSGSWKVAWHFETSSLGGNLSYQQGGMCTLYFSSPTSHLCPRTVALSQCHFDSSGHFHCYHSQDFIWKLSLGMKLGAATTYVAYIFCSLF